MTAESVVTEEQAQGAAPAPEDAAPVVTPGVGATLRGAREARGMALGEVAQALKLSPRQVQALEDENWAALPGAAFIKGFVRNYARLVGTDAAPLLAGLTLGDAAQPPRLDRPTMERRTLLPEPGRPQRKDYLAVLAGGTFLALALGAYFFLPADFWQKLPGLTTPAVERAAEPVTAAAPAADAAPGKAEPLPSEPASVAPPAGTPAAPPPPVAAEAPPAASQAAPASAPAVAGARALHFAFARASWVEVRDRDGQILHSQLNPAGSERQIEGTPPYRLIVGSASHVTLRYQGRTILLEPRSKDDVARLTLE